MDGCSVVDCVRVNSPSRRSWHVAARATNAEVVQREASAWSSSTPRERHAVDSIASHDVSNCKDVHICFTSTFGMMYIARLASPPLPWQDALFRRAGGSAPLERGYGPDGLLLAR